MSGGGDDPMMRELLGGTVCARSEGVGKGSEFVVWLPGPA